MERHRIVVAVAIAVAPVAGLIGFGCSDDDPSPIGMTSVDPGGTFGAEISVRVVGRGRVTGSIPTSIDCPGKCYVRYTFDSPSARGAADGLGLKAVATNGARFVGWRFENEQLGTKAKGPDNCSPVKRATSQPGDSNNAELKLTFGEVAGTAPAGQEGNCVGDLLKVPVAYKLVATFEDIQVPEAGPDADGGDGGDAASPGTVLFEAPVPGATGGDLFLLNGRLYWRFNSGIFQGIASGLATAPTTPATPQLVLPASSTIPRFEGDVANVVFQQSNGTLGVFNSSNPTTPVTNFTSPPTCDAVDSYSSLVYCLSGGVLYSWSTSGGARTTVLSGAPFSVSPNRTFAATSSYFWVPNDPGGSNTASLQRVLRSSADNDGGMLTWAPFITGETNPLRLQPNSFDYLFWIEYNSGADLGEVHTSQGSSSTVYVPIPAENGMRFVLPDTSSSSVVAGVSPAGGGAGKIYRTSAFTNASSVTPIVTNVPNMTGLAVDSNYFYWTQNDGRVYRRSKF